MNCSIENCRRHATARGWCSKHYQRWRKHGSPTVVLKSGPKPPPVSASIPGRTLFLTGIWVGVATAYFLFLSLI